MGTYDLATGVIVAAIPSAAIMLVLGAVLLARDAIARSPGIAITGFAATLAAFGMLFVERSCSTTVNRPIFTAVVGPASCRAEALASIEVVLLLGLATTLAVRLRRRQSGR